MSNYIGQGPVARENKKFFYKLTRNSNQELILTKVDLNTSSEEISINDPELRTAEAQHAFAGFGTDYVVINTDEHHAIIDQALGTSQYKVRNDDINYFVNEDGYLIARINARYSY